jgi:hypothetical protein
VADDFIKEDWYELYRNALMELRQAMMAGRILETRAAILARVEKLQHIPGLHAEEKLALADARSGLRPLEIEDRRLTSPQQREIAQTALDTLERLSPALQQIDFDSEQRN